MEPEDPLLHSQEPSSGPNPDQMNPVHTLFKTYFNIIFPAMLWSPNSLFPSGFLTKISYTFLPLLMVCSVHHIFLRSP